MCGIYGKLSSHQIDASIAETATDRLVQAVPTSGRTALQLAQCKNDRGLSAAKGVFDVSAAAAALVILAPLFAALALVVRLVIGKPILFKQQRRRAFTIYKFRTRSNARNAEGRFLPDAERLGWFGKFLRSTSLDELPELINVLRGEMSLVGPRPLLMEYLPRYSAEQMPRHDVLPGIDSLFQFKAQFSRRRDEFVTWRWIVAPETYRELSRQKQLSDSERGLRAISPSFFPAYRCPSEPDTVPAALRAPAPAMAAPDEIQVAQNG